MFTFHLSITNLLLNERQMDGIDDDDGPEEEWLGIGRINRYLIL